MGIEVICRQKCILKMKILTRINSKVLNQYLDKGVECQFFFRGSIGQDGKFVSFNGKNYCDLYIMELQTY